MMLAVETILQAVADNNLVQESVLQIIEKSLELMLILLLSILDRIPTIPRPSYSVIQVGILEPFPYHLGRYLRYL
jgi:hypothetical protein